FLPLELRRQEHSIHYGNQCPQRADRPDESALQICEVQILVPASRRRRSARQVLSEYFSWSCPHHQHRSQVPCQGRQNIPLCRVQGVRGPHRGRLLAQAPKQSADDLALLKQCLEALL